MVLLLLEHRRVYFSYVHEVVWVDAAEEVEILLAQSPVPDAEWSLIDGERVRFHNAGTGRDA
jgi:hypothetical protein